MIAPRMKELSTMQTGSRNQKNGIGEARFVQNARTTDAINGKKRISRIFPMKVDPNMRYKRIRIG